MLAGLSALGAITVIAVAVLALILWPDPDMEAAKYVF